MVEEKVYYGCMGEHSQRQKHLGEVKVVMTLRDMRRWGGEGRGKAEEQVQQPEGPRRRGNQMSELDRSGQPSPCAGEV